MNKASILRCFLLTSLFVLFVICSGISQGQKALQLTNVSTDKKLVLKEGHRVVYFLQDNTSRNIGIIEKVNESSVIISGEELRLDEFKSIGRKRKGSGFLATAGYTVGTLMIIGAVQNANSDPCPSCTNESSSGEGWTFVEIGLGAALFGLGVNTTIRNSPRDVVNKWKLEIVDSSTPASLKK
jgi:hypothetical protein